MDPIILIVTVVSIAALIMLGMNLYLALKHGKKAGPDESTVILHQRIDSLSQLLNDQLRTSRESSERATLSVHRQVESFTQNMAQLASTVSQVHESVKNVASLQNIFKAPKMRGTWGEASLESALSQYFPKERYAMQHYFKSGEAVDAILKLPNELLLPIDSKFNWDNFEKMIHAENDINRDIYKKQFLSDVKKKVEEIAAKYILPAEGTTDIALMYVPAETVYYEIINNIQDADIPAYARSKKIILVSPSTLYLTISAVLHWVRDVEITKQTKDIMKRLDRIAADGGKLSEEFRVLGKHLANAHTAYDDTEKRLSLMVDRVKNVIELGEIEENRKLEPPKV